MFDLKKLPGTIVARAYEPAKISALMRAFKKSGCEITRARDTIVVRCPPPKECVVFTALRHPCGHWITRHYEELFTEKPLAGVR